ncbi:MAG: thymidine phosphorylase [Gemmatimonadaceae bacterium]|nr:thymidine phosphorylase [Gemmatimonadaceae bacterium]
MIVTRVIERKRDGGRVAPEEWRELTRGYAAGTIPDYQMASLLMAIFLQGLDKGETAALTDAMIESGARLDLSHIALPRIDKHSTGGVGDKVSLILAPLIASLGVAVPMMSGRGLGHTGGTLDKLESIPGFRTKLSLGEVRAQIDKLGCALFGQSEEIAPADQKMYALRSATSTVEAIPLIASSIMSKKLAESLTGLVLDVKRGSGAFMQTMDLELAKAMIELGTERGCPVVALATAMDRPLGRACGNALEVEEAIAALHDEGPDDLMEVTYALGAEMLVLAGVAEIHLDAHDLMRQAIESGRAARKFREIIEAQGGDPRVVDDPALLPQASAVEIFSAVHDGIVHKVEPRAIGHGLVSLGAGRVRVDDDIDPSVGFVITAKPGDQVEKGEPLATVFASDDDGLRKGLEVLAGAIIIGEGPATSLPLISHRVTTAGVEEYVN